MKKHISIRLRDLASQENNDSEEYDLMMEASEVIDSLELECDGYKLRTLELETQMKDINHRLDNIINTLTSRI